MANLSHNQLQYAGFWRRLFAFLFDTFMLSVVSTALAITVFGIDSVMQAQTMPIYSKIDWSTMALDQIIPAIWTVSFWLMWKATPGKLLADCQIIDANTFEKASASRLILRYLCYFISAIPLGLGFLWIVFNKRNQGWHDKLSGTVVIMQDESLRKLESF